MTPPNVIRQELPGVPSAITRQAREHGLLELVIDEAGRVISMAMRESVHPMYDTMVLNAAKDWRYRPAMLQGKPVRFRKMIQVNVRRSESVLPSRPHCFLGRATASTGYCCRADVPSLGKARIRLDRVIFDDGWPIFHSSVGSAVDASSCRIASHVLRL